MNRYRIFYRGEGFGGCGPEGDERYVIVEATTAADALTMFDHNMRMTGRDEWARRAWRIEAMRPERPAPDGAVEALRNMRSPTGRQIYRGERGILLDAVPEGVEALVKVIWDQDELSKGLGYATDPCETHVVRMKDDVQPLRPENTPIVYPPW